MIMAFEPEVKEEMGRDRKYNKEVFYETFTPDFLKMIKIRRNGR